MDPNLDNYVLEGDPSMYADESRARRAVRHPGRAGARPHRAERGRDPRQRRQHPAHTGDPAVVRQGAQPRRLPLGPPPPRRGRDRRLRAVGTCPHLLRREVRGLPRHVRGRLGVRAALHAARRVQPGPQQPAHVDDHPDARRTSWSTCRRSTTPTCATGRTDRDRRVTPSPTSQIFTDAVALTECDAEVFDLAFTATTQPCPWPKAYGGDMVAQALVAAALTVTDGKTMHSMHSYFMRPVDIGAEVRYEVEVLRDGRGYSTRQVRGFQNGKAVYVCLASFAAGEPSGTFQATAPADVPAPDDLPTSADYLEDRTGGTMTDDVEGVLVRRPQLRHAPRPRPGLPHGRGRAVAPPGGLGEAVRRPASGRRAHRRAARHRRAGLRLRLHDPRADPAGPRPRVGGRGPRHREPRPRHVVPPPGGDGRLAALRAGGRLRRGRARRRPSAASSPRTARSSRPSSRRA